MILCCLPCLLVSAQSMSLAELEEKVYDKFAIRIERVQVIVAGSGMKLMNNDPGSSDP